MKKNSIILFLLLLTAIVNGQKEKVKVFVTISEECPISIAMVDDLKTLQTHYGSEIEFTLVFPMLTSDSLTALQFVADYELKGFELMVSNANKFCQNYSLKITPEAMVLSPEGKTIYRGRINNLYQSPGKKNHKSDKQDLNDAIYSEIKNLPPRSVWPKAIGCTITYEQ